MIEDLTERFEALHPHPDSGWFVETRPHAAEFYRHDLHAQEMFCELTDSSSPQYPPSADDPRALGELVQESEDASRHAERGVQGFEWTGPPPAPHDRAGTPRYISAAQRALDPRWGQPARAEAPPAASATRVNTSVFELVTTQWPLECTTVHVVEDQYGALWPSWVDRQAWICHRTFSRTERPEQLCVCQASPSGKSPTPTGPSSPRPLQRRGSRLSSCWRLRGIDWWAPTPSSIPRSPSAQTTTRKTGSSKDFKTLWKAALHNRGCRRGSRGSGASIAG
ncbi:hypothetical protein QDX25_01705 [Auritidibacter ignavus]|uniref:hypothetical protein n=1 Tax=Auritidibacter ignavus TaxID=678932 RepID=UPI002446FA10|nr:hypothetical protein [Auritidibacter ignavus]WGH81919.1 hypothetical protein QDX25_01705 [Auritidibacter ignavus]